MRIYAKADIFAKSRITKGYSQRELAKRAGLSHAYISLIESRQKNVGPAAAKRICDLLERDVEELFVIELS
jgi:transcriptional regulator with XRE-family HTH domain